LKSVNLPHWTTTSLEWKQRDGLVTCSSDSPQLGTSVHLVMFVASEWQEKPLPSQIGCCGGAVRLWGERRVLWFIHNIKIYWDNAIIYWDNAIIYWDNPLKRGGGKGGGGGSASHYMDVQQRMAAIWKRWGFKPSNTIHSPIIVFMNTWWPLEMNLSITSLWQYVFLWFHSITTLMHNLPNWDTLCSKTHMWLSPQTSLLMVSTATHRLVRVL